MHLPAETKTLPRYKDLSEIICGSQPDSVLHLPGSIRKVIKPACTGDTLRHDLLGVTSLQ